MDFILDKVTLLDSFLKKWLGYWRNYEKNNDSYRNYENISESELAKHTSVKKYVFLF
jgi:hypothetical protein